jgi:uncharacterized repeat protein (TIGR01451 family)
MPDPIDQTGSNDLPSLLGKTIEHYQIVAQLGQERWGESFKAYDAKFDRTVNFQALSSDWAKHNHQGEYALQTARAILRFRQAGIARVFDAGQSENLNYIVGEFIPGADLAQLLDTLRKAHQWISLGEAVQISLEIVQALDYAHLRGLVHGDFQPRRVSLRAEPSANLPYQAAITRLGFVHPDQPGSAPASAYQAPEISGLKRINSKVDIYAAGMVIFELATGQVPTASPPPNPRSLRADLPAEVEQIITTCLSANPAWRFADAGALGKALLAALPKAVAIGSTPVGLKEITSLLPALQASLIDPRRSPLQPEAATSSAQGQASVAKERKPDLLHILEPGQPESRSLEISARSMTLGRGSDNDIVIDRPGISRHHARLDFDGSNYTITDLHSTNGTFREEQILPPGEAVIWAPGENLRIGEVWLRLERAGQTQTTRAFVPEATRPAIHQPVTEAIFIDAGGRSIDASQVSQSARGWVSASVDPANLGATPGSIASFNLKMYNRGPQSDTFLISLQGIPADWIVGPPRPVVIQAGGDREVTITVRPPRTSAGRAGRHQILTRVASQSAPSEIVEGRVQLTVTAFSEFYSEMQPRQVRSGQVGQVMLQNRGNLPETYTLLWEDHFQNLVFEPPQVKVTIPPGKSAVVEYRPGLLHPRWFGGETTHPYKTHVNTQAGQLQSLSGEYIGKALVPPWAPLGFAALCVVLACFMLVLANQITAPGRNSRRTAEAAAATIVYATQQAAQVSTQTAVSLSEANQATLQAVTATAFWTTGDDDEDGLTNNLEVLAGTQPNDPDTDRDGLDDGPEVNTWKTNPLNPDTDGDSLYDGLEVDLDTNPLKRDTDGDGLPDANDPDPVNPPTRTPVVIYTFTPRLPTLTPTTQVYTVDLNVSISNGRNTSVPGTAVSYTIVVGNRGPSPANNVNVTAVMPPALINSTWGCAAASNSRCQTPNGTGNVNARLDLAPGGQATVTVNAQIPASASGQVTLSVQVSQALGVIETYPIDNLASDVDNLTPRVSLSLSKTDGRTTILPGDSLVYTIEVRNGGPSLTSGVSLVDNFAAELTGITWSCSASAGGNCSVSGTQSGNVNTLLSLPPGGAATVTVNATVRPAAQGTLSNTATITSPIDPGENNKSATDTTSIAPLVDLELQVSSPPTITVGTLMTYTLDIANLGPGLGTGLALELTKPPDVPFITYTLSTPSTTVVCNPALGQVICNLGNLPDAEALQMEIVVLSQPVTGVLRSVFELRSNENDPNLVNNTVEVNTPVE